MTIEDAMRETGTTTPRAALEKMNEGGKRHVYLPHVGAKQRAKEARRQAKAAAKEKRDE
jgi:hypothetical protein